MQMNIRGMISTLACVLGTAALAQNMGQMEGRVFDAAGDPVMFASVRVQQADKVLGAETDEQGRFSIKALSPGHYDVKISYAGMHDHLLEQVRVDPDLTVRLPRIVMQSETLGTVIVSRNKWEEPLIRPEDPSRMVLTAAQIKKVPVRKDPVRLVAIMTPGVTKAHNSDELYFRGSRTGAVAYFVDGVRMSSLTGVPPDAIGRISVYTGGLPARYGDVTGGVVAIETKSYFDLYQQRNAGY